MRTGRYAGAVTGRQYATSGMSVAEVLTFGNIAGQNAGAEEPWEQCPDGTIGATVFGQGEPDSSGSPFLLCVTRTVVLRAGRARPPRAEIGEGEGDGHTGKYHLRNILGKLDLRNRVQAVVFDVRQGLVENPPHS